MTIIVKQDGSKAVRVEKTGFAKEDALQSYIYENPQALPLDDIQEDTKLLILAREFPTNSGPIDALGIDQFGGLYIVETKLYKNSDKRIVIAQALDYGASLWKHSSDFSSFLATLDEFIRDTFGVSVQEKIKNFFALDEEAVQLLLTATEKNLSDGVYQFIVLMDKLDDRLKDLIVYVNQNSQFDIYAVELEYYRHDSYEIVIPRLFGAQVKKDIGSSSTARRTWTEAALRQDAEAKLSPEELAGFFRIYDFTRLRADETRLGTGSYGSFSAIFYPLGKKSLFTLATDRRLAFNFNWIEDPKTAESFKDKLTELGFRFPANYADYRPSVLAEEWLPRQEAILGVIDSMLQETQSSTLV